MYDRYRRLLALKKALLRNIKLIYIHECECVYIKRFCANFSGNAILFDAYGKFEATEPSFDRVTHKPITMPP